MLVLGRSRCTRSIESHQRDRRPARRDRHAAAATHASRRSTRRTRADGRGDGIRLPVRRRAAAAVDRLSGRRRHARPSCYDLLASEARLASFVAIAKGDVPTRHWFRLGRTRHAGRTAARRSISWSGSMFEYLMPSLVMRAPRGSLLDADEPARRAPADRIRRGAAACPGASRNRPTTRATWSSPISTRTSACPASGSSAASARTPSWRPTRRRWRRWSTPHAAARNFARLAGAGATRPVRLLRGARLHASPSARRARRWRSCAPTWRTTRA